MIDSGNTILDEPAQTPEPPAEMAGFGLRAIAWLIDKLILGLIIAAVIAVFVWLFMLKQDETAEESEWYYQILGGLIWLALLLLLLYPALFEASTWQATPGKKAMNIIVVDTEGQRLTLQRALIRNLTKGFSNVFFIGYLMVLWTSQQQALHDILAGAYVVKGDRG